MYEAVFESLSTVSDFEMDLSGLGPLPVSIPPPGYRQRATFAPNEDAELARLVGELGTSNWKEVAERIPGRSARQCRERWNLYLSTTASNAPWSLEDDFRLIALYQAHGPKWSMMAKDFPARTANNLKNRHRQLQRKGQRLTRLT
jgi:hypothetical protein